MALTAALIVLAPGAAIADPEIKPSRKTGSVLLKNIKTTYKTTRAVTAGIVASQPPRRVPLQFSECRVDAEVGIYGCNEPDPPEPDDGPEITEAGILRAAQEIGMPRLEVRIQPGTRTLVNAETIFYAEPEPFQRSVTLLGTGVDLVAEPARFTWVHGDGTSRSTSQAGRPYPAFDVTHRYQRAADRVDARVDVTYRVRYRIDDGGWQELGQTLTASGPTSALEVREAAPVLTRP